MVAIIPPGNYSNQWPRYINESSAHIAASELAKEINALNASISQATFVVKNNIKKYSRFFTAHFGMKVEQGIIDKYFAGNDITQGAGTNAITEEIFQFTSPKISDYGGTRDTISSVVLGLSQMLRLPVQRDAKLEQAMPNIESAVFDLTYRPDFDAMLALGSSSATVLSGKINALPQSISADAASYKGINKTYTKTHEDGYVMKVKAILQFYDQAVSTRQPAKFWEYLSKHRLVIVQRPGSSTIEVHITEVDPATGALKARYGTTVATIEPNVPIDTTLYHNPSLFLSKVRKNLFPEMYLYKEGMTISADDRLDVYKKQLEDAAMLWKGIPNKDAMPMAVVISEQFDAQKPSQKAGPNTGVPIRVLKIYLQPPGTEAAMKRLLDANDPKALLEGQLKYSMGLGTEVSHSPKSGYTYMVDGARLNNLTLYRDEFKYLSEFILLTLSNPALYAQGLPFLNGMVSTTFNGTESDVIRNYYMQNLERAQAHKKTLTRFNAMKLNSLWPSAPPVKIFEAPFDDEQDLKMLVNMFKNYMLKNAGSHPAELKVPEPYNGRIVSTKDTTHEHFGIRPGLAMSTFRPNKSYAKYDYEASYSPGTTYKQQRYYTQALGLTSGKQYGTTSVEKLPMSIERSAKGTTVRNPLASPTMQGINRSLMVGGSLGLIGVATIVGAWLTYDGRKYDANKKF